MCIYIFKACVQLYVYSHISKYILEYIYQHTRHCFIKMGAMFYVVCCTMILSLTNTLWKSLWVIWWKPNSYFYWLGNILLCEWSNFQSIVFLSRGFPSGSVVKNLPAKQETEVWSLGWEDPREEGTATHSSILAWRIPGQRSLVNYSPSHRRVGTWPSHWLSHFH